MKKITSLNLLTRLFSLFAFLAVAAIESSGTSFFHGASAASAVVLLFPLSYERSRTSFICAGSLALVLVAIQWFTSDCSLIVITGAASLLVYCAVRGRRHFKNVRGLFSGNTPWHFVESYARFLWLLLYLLLSAAGLKFLHREWAVIPAGAVMTLFYLALLIRARSGRTWMLSAAREDNLHKLTARSFSSMPPESTEEGKRLSQIYERAVACMEEKRPYLDDKFSLPGLAGMIYTNKVSLSRAISYCTGGNFSKFSNRYRVGYAVELMKRDPRMKVFELSELSGFHNTVTFGLAFKTIMSKTPGEYKEELALKKRH